MKSKADIRTQILEKRDSLPEKEIKLLSMKIKERIFSLGEFKKAKNVMLFVSFGSEVFTHEMILDALKSKNVIVPKIVDGKLAPVRILSFEDLSSQKMNISEPKSSECFDKRKIDLVVVPGVAFDSRGYRIGYGKGYYDDFLAGLKIPKIAIGFDLQVVERVPHEKHDVPVDMVVTDKRVLNCRLS